MTTSTERALSFADDSAIDVVIAMLESSYRDYLNAAEEHKNTSIGKECEAISKAILIELSFAKAIREKHEVKP